MPSSDPERTPREIEALAKQEREAARRRRAHELLGDLLPATTKDDTDEGWGDRPAPTSDEQYLRDVPPHHG